MSTLQDSDLFVVDRNGTNYKVTNSQMSTLQDTDLFVVERSGTNYKIEAKDVGSGTTGSIATPVAVLTPLNGAGTNAGQPYQPLSREITAVGAGGSAEFKTDTIANVVAATTTGITAVVTGWGLPGNAINTADPTNTRATSQNETAGKITFDTPIQGVTKVEAYTRFYNNGTAGLKKADGSDIQVNIAADGTRWYTVYEGEAIDLKQYYQQMSSNDSDDFWALRLNNTAVGNPTQPSNLASGPVDPLPSSNIILTFPTDNNFDKFEVGDVVQNPYAITAKNPDGPTITTSGGSWLGSDGSGDNDGLTLTELHWNIPNGGTWSIYEIRINGTAITDPSLVTFGAGVSNPELIIDGDPDTGGSGNGTPTSTIVVDVSSFNPISSIDCKDYGDGSTWMGFQPNGKAQWIGYNGATEVDLTVVNADGYAFYNRFSGVVGATDVTKTVTSDATLTFTDNTELANMVGPLTMVDENGDVKIPVTSTIASVGTSSVPVTGTISGTAFNTTLTWSKTFDVALDGNGAVGTNYKWTFDAIQNVTEVEILSVYDLTGWVVVWDENGVGTPLNSTNAPGTFFSTNPYPASYTSFNSGAGAWKSFKYNVPSGRVSAVSVPSASGRISGIVFDGVPVITGEMRSGGEILTFASPNPELQHFQVGDDVGFKSGFVPVIYAGVGGTQSITTGFSPDLVWFKSRDDTQNYALTDSVTGPNKRLSSNTPGLQVPDTSVLTAFTADGFTIGGGYEVNKPSDDYVAWCWDAGDTTVTNSDGTIPSQVRSNGNFSVVQYSGNAAADATIGHGLSKAPAFIITRPYNVDANWVVGSEDMPWSTPMFLNDDAQATSNAYFGTSPSILSTTYSVSQLDGLTNGVGRDFISYCWAETPGVSSFGSYDGNGINTGPVIDCGFEPAFVMIKRTDVSNNWVTVDNARNPSNPVDRALYADLPNNESVVQRLNFTSNGFSIINGVSEINADTGNYIYAAFAGSSSVEVIDVDVAANTMTVDKDFYEVGDTVAGPPLAASANDVEYLDGNTLGVNGVSGTWLTGLHAQGAEITASAPSPDSVQYTSANGDPLTTQFTGTDATLTTRTWTWQVSDAVTGPWTNFATKIDAPGQDGATALVDRPTLEENKFYQVKVRYNSDNAEYVESTFNTFKTGTNS